MSQENPKQRIDPNNVMGLEWHAGRVLLRKRDDGTPEFEGLSMEELRAAISNPETRFREGDVMRDMLLSMLSHIEGVRTPEQQKLFDRLMQQRKQMAAIWFEKFPLQVPISQAEVVARIEKWLQNLPANVLQGFAKLCPDSAQLVVVPPESALKILEAMDENLVIPHQRKSVIWAADLWNEVMTDKWKFGITDGKEELDFDPNIFWKNPQEPDEYKRNKRTNEQMLAEYEGRFKGHKLDIMPQYASIPATAARLASGNVLDRRFCTVFKKPQGAKSLQTSCWDINRVSLSGADPAESSYSLRWRPWYEGEM